MPEVLSDTERGATRGESSSGDMRTTRLGFANKARPTSDDVPTVPNTCSNLVPTPGILRETMYFILFLLALSHIMG